jgi:hypothetical protein
MKDGRLRFSVPSPKLVQAPRLGRATVNDPVWMPSVALKWFECDVCIERIRAMSSRQPAMCGKSELDWVPASPCGANSHWGRLRKIFS